MIRAILAQFNPNVEIPMPKLLQLKKIALKLDEYDNLRNGLENIPDLKEPAPCIPQFGDPEAS